MAALLAGYGVYASLLNVTGQAGTGLQTGTDDSASVSVGCQTAPVQVRPVYEEKFTAATGFDVPLTAFEISGVQAACVTAKSAWVLAVELNGEFQELADVLVLADAVPVGGQSSGVYRIKPEPITAVASMGITGYSIRAAPEEKPPAPGLWVAPGDTTGLAYVYEPQTQAPWPIAEYEYSLFIDTGNAWTAVGALGEWTTLPISRPGPTQLSLSGLTNGALYQVRVRALNKISPYERFISNVATYDFIPRTTPDAPTGLSATAGDSQISVAFTAPAFNGGAEIWTYQYQLSTDNGSTWSAWTNRSDYAWYGSPNSPLVITGLFNSLTYQVKLRAVNVAGPGTESDAASVNLPLQVLAFGSNTKGQLGDGTTTMRTTPVTVTSSGALAGKVATQVSAGTYHSCTLDSQGKAYCWGRNDERQLGDGTNIDKFAPAAVDTSGALSAKTLTQISAGESHTCALDADGMAYCWGYGYSGRLGDGTNENRSSPVAVLGGIAFTKISAGGSHSCALDVTGKAYCWGSNFAGSLGDGAGQDSSIPVLVNTSAVPAGRALTHISAGQNHTCAVDSGGAAYCWGYNESGRLGDGTTTNRTTPVAVNTSGALSGKTLNRISAGANHTCSIDNTGAAYCWGNNASGRIGDGTDTSRPLPVAVGGGYVFSEVSTGSNFTCALGTDNRARCWGNNSQGQFGNNMTSSVNSLPVPAGNGRLFTQIDTGENHTIGLS